MIAVLAGGVGAAKFLDGLAALIPPDEITVIVNTGDDATFHGLQISPDIDTVLYTLSGLVHPERGWGVASDTFHCLESLKRLGAEDTWFQLGDRDLALHLFRSQRLREGAPLSLVIREICSALKIACHIIPMSDSPARTRLRTPEGVLSFQEYFVKLAQRPEVLAVDLSEAESANPGHGVLESFSGAEAIILAPSNPIISIGPILAVPGIRDALRQSRAPVAAISPIVGGKALKGPADRMLKSLGMESSATSVAELYRDFLDLMVIDVQDAGRREEIERNGIRVLVTDTIMHDANARRELARRVLSAVRITG